uniref:Orphan peptide AbOp-1 n=1 Tax=Androctonus bicolor TaxID=748906 RepID=A0A0K0LC30_9SCOR|nr:orphan peptide AbOp-1 [Androctonus bicolor]
MKANMVASMFLLFFSLLLLSDGQPSPPNMRRRPCDDVKCHYPKHCVLKIYECKSYYCYVVPYCTKVNPACPMPMCGPECFGFWLTKKNCLRCAC